jgi:hypothetical protein
MTDINAIADRAARSGWFRIPRAEEGPLTDNGYRYRSGAWAIDVFYGPGNRPVSAEIVDWPDNATRASARRKLKVLLSRLLESEETA